MLFLVFKARKLLYLLKLYLSYLLVKCASSNIIITPQVMATFVILCLLYYLMKRFTSLWDGIHMVNTTCCYMDKFTFVLVFYALSICTRACVFYVIVNMSVNCTELPAKPLLTAHRGCKDVSYAFSSPIIFIAV